MELLHSMTGATPEERLLLLQWALVIEMMKNTNVLEPLLVPAEPKQLARTFKSTERRVRLSLEYLVQEGYVDKYSNTYLRLKGVKGPKFEYFLAATTWRLWGQLYSQCLLKEEFYQALLGMDTNFPRRQIRLLWAILACSADKFGYITSQRMSEMKHLLGGISDNEIRLSLQVLKRLGCVSMLAREVGYTAFWGYLPAIFQLQLKADNPQVVRLGVSLPLYIFRQSDLLTQIFRYRRRAKLRVNKKDKVLEQSYPVTDEQYYDYLSKHFFDKKIILYIHQLCILTIFSLSQEIIESSKERDLSDLLNSHELKKMAITKLRDILIPSLSGSVLPLEISLPIEPKDNVDALNSLLKGFLLKKLATEVTTKVIEVVQQVDVFAKTYDLSIRQISYVPKEMIIITKPELDLIAKSVLQDTIDPESSIEQNDSSEQQASNISFLVLMLNLTCSQEIKDSVVFGGVVLTAGPKPKRNPNPTPKDEDVNSNFVQVDTIHVVSTGRRSKN
ncbi:hypothetical protein HG547_03265 [Shewanella sp. DNRA4]|uniref:hypothetical protein n=1 Tax=Shewanella sp. DNRA4 TaxID=2723055 RepID=UPI00146C87E5|nr:hypothetical protein [Shewanella sp. DNRA4]NMD50652.1 hypothetical protein [Shewanella sp. DNRA4]